MARATAIETRLERLLPAMEEYFSSGFLTREETHDVARQRSHWEYRLVAKPLLLLDVQNAARYELELEGRLRRYCIATKLMLRHRWSIIERVEYIYRIGLRHIKDPEEWEVLRREYVAVLKEHNRHGQLSALYAELMVRFPTRSALWVEATLYEGVEAENASGARAIVQQAVLTAGSQPDVWNAAVVVELYFTDRLLKKLLEDNKKEEGGGKEVEEEAEKGQAAAKVRRNRNTVTELRAENAALAEVVVDLALVHAVVEEALDSPAFGPRLVRMLVDSVTQFSYTKPVLERLLEGAAKRMTAVLRSRLSSGATGNNNCNSGASSGSPNAGSLCPNTVHSLAMRQWTEVSVSQFLEDYLALEAIMAERGVAGDAALLLQSGGKPPSVGKGEKKVAYVTSLVSSLVLLCADEGEFPVLSLLRPGAISVVENLMEGLRKLGCAGAVSAACRCLFLSGHERQGQLRGAKRQDAGSAEGGVTTTIDEVLECMWKVTKGQKREHVQQVRDAAVKRIAVMLADRQEESSVPLEKKVMKRPRAEDLAQVWQPLARFLLPEDRAAVRKEGPKVLLRCTTAEVSILFSLHAQDGVTDAETVGKAVMGFLQRFELVPPTAGVEGARRLRFTEGRTPVSLWKLFLLLERCCHAVVTDSLPQLCNARCDSSDSDEDGTDGRGGGSGLARNGTCNSNDDLSFAAAGLKFLSGVPCGVLPDSAIEEERLKGCWALVVARVRTITGVGSITRESFVSGLRHMSGDGSVPASGMSAWVEGVRSILSVARLCHPLPRQIYADIAVPFFEAVALFVQQRKQQREAQTNVNAAVQEARDAHTGVLSVYTQSRNLNNYTPLVYHVKQTDRDVGEGENGKPVDFVTGSRVSAAELNATDWARFVAFERDVAKDLRRSKEVSAQARREAIAPQQLFSALNNH